MVYFFCIFEIIILCFVVTMSDLVHYVEAVYGLCLLLIGPGKSFLIYELWP